MRSVLVLGLLIAWCAVANAATVRRPKPPPDRSHQVQRVDVPKVSVVPGWTDAQTRQWLDDATGPKD
jgi:hypothetical protein